ncbi:hypothetical protein Hdeb2414_s0027g00697091 [Helianthus debilis subsp. tardiflorus]
MKPPPPENSQPSLRNHLVRVNNSGGTATRRSHEDDVEGSRPGSRRLHFVPCSITSHRSLPEIEARRESHLLFRLTALVHSIGILQSLLVRYFEKSPNATTSILGSKMLKRLQTYLLVMPVVAIEVPPLIEASSTQLKDLTNTICY